MALNLKEGFGEDDIVPMLASTRDEVGPHILWVSKKGDVWLDVVPQSLTAEAYLKLRRDDVQFHFEPFGKGAGIVGEAGSQNFVMVVRLHHALKQNWQRGYKGQVETY